MLFILMPIPVVWALLAHFGKLDGLKNSMMDARFNFRGELQLEYEQIPSLPDSNSSKPKVVYVDFDQRALSSPKAGERPWDRQFFAKAASYLLDERVGTRAVGYDFIFSNNSMSKMVPEELIYQSENKIGDLIRKYPDQVVLGANYTAVSFEFQGERISSAALLIYQSGYKPEMARNYPEAPTYPMLFYKDGLPQGRLGILAAEMERSKGAIPRWAPMFFPYEGDAHAKKQLVGLQFAQPIKWKKIQAEEAFQSAKSEVDSLRKESQSIKSKVSELKDNLQELNQAKPKLPSNFLELLKKIASARKLVEEKDASVKQLLAAIQANPASTPAHQKEFQTNVAAKSVAEKELNDLKATISGELETKLRQAEQALERLEATAKANATAAARLKPAIDKNKQTVEEAQEALTVLNAELENAGLLTSISTLQAQAAKAETALKKLQAADKANPTAAFKDNIDNYKRYVNAAHEKIFKVQKQIEDNELLADFTMRLEERNKLLAKKSAKWETQMTEAQESLAAMEVQAEDTQKLLLDAVEDFNVTSMLLNSIQASPFDRSEIKFEKTEDGKLWLLKSRDGETLNEVPADCGDNRIYHFAVSLILAAYGLDGSHVEIDDKKIIITDDGGEIIVDAPLTDKQLLEVNWFSGWREDVYDIVARESLGRCRDNKDFHGFFHAAEDALTGAVNRVLGKEVEAKSNLEEELAIIKLPNDLRTKANDLLAKIKKHDGTEELDDWYDTAMAVLGELARQSIPPFITCHYNPRCSIIDIFNYGDFYFDEAIREAAANYEANVAKIDAAVASLMKFVEKSPELEAKAGPLIKKAKEDKASLSAIKEDYDRAEQFFSHFKNAIVLIGPVDPTFQDLAPTPFDSAPVPKVGVHGNLVKTMLSGQYIKRLGQNWEMAGIFGFGMLMILTGFYNGPYSLVLKPALGIMLTGVYIFVGLYVFQTSNLVIPIAAPALSALSTNFFSLIAIVIIEFKAKARIKDIFGSYVSPELVEEMVESGKEPSLGGEEQQITAYFSDVQSFSTFSELLSPTSLVDLMNEYLTAMTNILHEERGTLDKYIGDAIVAMYGAPIPMSDHAYQGVKTAVRMQIEQAELRKKWKAEGDKWPEIVSNMQTRIGLNSGTATVGNMGALNRFNYTMMGDMVNLAARSESGAKAYGAYTMITEDTKRAAEEQGSGIAYRYLDKIVVKGRTRPVEIYEVVGFNDLIGQEALDCLELFQQGIDNYLKQEWDKAEALFERAKKLEPNKPGITPGVKDNPSMILIDRVRAMRDNPPREDWDGVYIMKSK
jgi:class 3 adenylate cyclase/CHASE2 domain-containing sensor protein